MRVRPITASRDVAVAPDRTYAFLVRLDNHWQLGHSSLRVHAVDDDRRGGCIRITGSFGLERTARTAVTTEERPRRFGGVAAIRRTSARVMWSIDPAAAGSRVVLQSTILRLGIVDRALLALGGRWRLRRDFRRVLDRLARAMEDSPGRAGRADRCGVGERVNATAIGAAAIAAALSASGRALPYQACVPPQCGQPTEVETGA